MSNETTEQLLEKLPNFNLIKYTDHYVLTIQLAGGKPVIFEADTLEEVITKYREQWDVSYV